MIIFGWGYETRKEYGPTLLARCPNCNNEVFLYLFHIRVWFTLFFIPVIPYESKWHLLCEVCSRGVELNGDDIEKVKKLSLTTKAFLNKEITQNRYAEVLNETRLAE